MRAIQYSEMQNVDQFLLSGDKLQLRVNVSRPRRQNVQFATKKRLRTRRQNVAGSSGASGPLQKNLRPWNVTIRKHPEAFERWKEVQDKMKIPWTSTGRDWNKQPNKPKGLFKVVSVVNIYIFFYSKIYFYNLYYLCTLTPGVQLRQEVKSLLQKVPRLHFPAHFQLYIHSENPLK